MKYLKGKKIPIPLILQRKRIVVTKEMVFGLFTKEQLNTLKTMLKRKRKKLDVLSVWLSFHSKSVLKSDVRVCFKCLIIENEANVCPNKGNGSYDDLFVSQYWY